MYEKSWFDKMTLYVTILKPHRAQCGDKQEVWMQTPGPLFKRHTWSLVCACGKYLKANNNQIQEDVVFQS